MSLSPKLSPLFFSGFPFVNSSTYDRFGAFSYYRGGYIYGAYCHQKRVNTMKSLLKEPVLIVVTKVVTLFERFRRVFELRQI